MDVVRPFKVVLRCGIGGWHEAKKARINLATTFTDYRRGGACPRPKETQMRKAEQESVASSQ